MKTQHTPGPWEIAEDRFIRNIEGQTIAEVQEWHQFVTQCKDGTLDIDKEEMPWKANARLIAAAPELLEILKESVWYIDFGDSGAIEWHEQMEKLIAKIEGDESNTGV